MPFLYLVLVVAFCVRFYGIWANLPYVVHPDEPQIVNRALSLNPSDMNPHFFDWPGSLLIYVLFVCYRMLSLFGNLFRGIFGTPPGFIEDISTYYFIGRFVVVLFGVATIYLVYQIGLKIYDARVGLVAALFLTFSFLHVEASHHALPDIPLTFFMMLSFFRCFRIYESGQRRDYILAGFHAGLAVALKYNGGMLVIPICVAHILHKLSQKRPKDTVFSKNLYLAFLMMGAGFILACPYVILDFNGFWADFSMQIAHQTSGHIGAEPSGNGWFYLLSHTLRNGMGLILLTLSLAGFFYAIARISFTNTLLLSLPFAYFFVMGASRVQFGRYVTPLLPFLALLAAKLFIDGVSCIFRKLNLATRPRQFLALSSAAVLVLLPGWSIAGYDWNISQKDTRVIAKKWIEGNIAPGSVIAFETYGPPLFQFQKHDDGSTDGSFEVLQKLYKRTTELNPSVVVIQFRRNFGKAAALMAGFQAAQSTRIITMDADLQDEPNEIPRLLAKLDEGYDVVSGWKRKRFDPLSKTLPSKLFNKVTAKITGISIHDFNCGFKAYRREVIQNLTIYGELHRYIPVLAYYKGYRVGEVEVQHHPRRYGKSKYGFSRLFKGFFDFLTVLFLAGYAKRPLHVFGSIGLPLTLAGLGACLYLATLWFFGQGIGTRPLLTLGVLLIILGSQFISIGLLGEMITATHSRREDGYSIRQIFHPKSPLEELIVGDVAGRRKMDLTSHGGGNAR